MRDSRTIGVSTAWNALRHGSGKEMVRELLDLGFDLLELNVHVTPGMIKEVRGMVKRGQVRVCSLHNYCPLPAGVERDRAAGNVLPLSSTDEAERAAAVAQAKQTIEWAARLEAAAVVLHLGAVPMERRQREALRLIGAGNQEQARAIVAEDLIERAAVRQPYINSVIASMGELAGHAEAAGVKLGLETRDCYSEIPSLDEFQMIFKNVVSPALGYWHDTGHAHVREVLRIAEQEDYLKKYGDRLVGIHIHDAVGGSDHRALGRGEIDFSKILPYVRPDVDIVLEIHSQASGAELIRSREVALRVLRDSERSEQQ